MLLFKRGTTRYDIVGEGGEEKRKSGDAQEAVQPKPLLVGLVAQAHRLGPRRDLISCVFHPLPDKERSARGQRPLLKLDSELESVPELWGLADSTLIGVPGLATARRAGVSLLHLHTTCCTC